MEIYRELLTPAAFNAGLTTSCTLTNITVVVSSLFFCSETHPFGFFFYQVPSLRGERSQESGTDGHHFSLSLTLSKFTHTHTHTQRSIVCLFQWLLLRRLLLPSLTANNKELNVFATKEMDEKE